LGKPSSFPRRLAHPCNPLHKAEGFTNHPWLFRERQFVYLHAKGGDIFSSLSDICLAIEEARIEKLSCSIDGLGISGRHFSRLLNQLIEGNLQSCVCLLILKVPWPIRLIWCRAIKKNRVYVYFIYHRFINP
jgi:hypothetical protein